MSHGGVLAHMVEQLHPTSHWGTEYVVRPLGQNGYGDILKISTQKDNTTIDMQGFPIIVVTNKKHNVWRRLDKDMESYIKASKPIEVVQITGLAYGSANDILQAGMTVVPAIENGARNFKSSCGKEKDGEFHIVTEISALAQTMVGNARFTKPRKIAHTQYLIGSINATAMDVHDVVNENADIRGVVKCEGTAVMALGLVHQQMNITQEHKVPPPEEILCKEMLTGSITLNHRAQSLTRHEVKFDHKTTIMQLRLRSCGPFSIQFLEDMNSIGNYFLFTITKTEILVGKCYTNCEKRNIIETSEYNGEFNCKTDMQLYWFRLDSQNDKLCFGTGPFADRKNCNKQIAMNRLFQRALMTSSGNAEFNYDLETEEDCDYRMSVQMAGYFDRWGIRSLTEDEFQEIYFSTLTQLFDIPTQQLLRNVDVGNTRLLSKVIRRLNGSPDEMPSNSALYLDLCYLTLGQPFLKRFHGPEAGSNTNFVPRTSIVSNIFGREIPIENYLKIFFTFAGAMIELFDNRPTFIDEDGHFRKITNLQHISIYCLLFVHSVLELLRIRKVLHIDGLSHLSAALGFFWYGSVFHFHTVTYSDQLETIVHIMGMLWCFGTALSFLWESRSEDKFLPGYCRCLAILGLGTWFIHTPFLLFSSASFPGKDTNPRWDRDDPRNYQFVATMFAFHVCFHIVLSVLIYAILRCIVKPVSVLKTTQFRRLPNDNTELWEEKSAFLSDEDI